MKKWMGILLSLVILLTAMPVATYAEGDTFSDMPEDWSTEALEKAVENGLLMGSDGKIMPKENLTRAQMATVINRAFGAEREESLERFDDVDENQWFYPEMAKAVAMETFEGSGTSLKPNDFITREQAFAVIVRALKIRESSELPVGFSDLSEISSWAKGEVYTLINNGYIQGSNGKINPHGYITRAEFAQVMDNIIKNYVNEAGEYNLEETGNLMINVPGVTLKDSKIKGDLLIGDGLGEGDLILDNVEVTGRLLVRGGGIESIIIKGKSNIASITTAKVKNPLRIQGEEGTIIGDVTVAGKDNLTLEGKYKDIEVLSDHISVWATDAIINEAIVKGDNSRIIIGKSSTLNKLVLKGEKSRAEILGEVKNIEVQDTAKEALITIKKDGKVETIIVNSAGTKINGEGRLEEVRANADNVVVENIGAKVYAGKGTKGVMAGDEEVIAGGYKVVGEDRITLPDPSPGIPVIPTAKEVFLKELKIILGDIDNKVAIAKVEGEDFIVEFKEEANIEDIERAAEGVILAIKELDSNARLTIVGNNYNISETSAREIAREILKENLENFQGLIEGSGEFLDQGKEIKEAYTANIKTTDSFELRGNVIFRVR